MGADKPLMRPRRNCPEIHGASGLDGPDIPTAPQGARAEKAVTAMAAAIRSHAPGPHATATAPADKVRTLNPKP